MAEIKLESVRTRDLISISNFAKKAGVTHSAIDLALKKGYLLNFVRISGIRFIYHDGFAEAYLCKHEFLSKQKTERGK